jgi:hypothetical protein
MVDLKANTNIYANLAQSAYTSRPNRFPYNQLKPSNKKKIDSGKSVKIDYGKPVGKVYLQPDPTVKTIKEQRTIPFSTTETSQTYTYSYQKELLTDEKAA